MIINVKSLVKDVIKKIYLYFKPNLIRLFLVLLAVIISYWWIGDIVVAIIISYSLGVIILQWDNRLFFVFGLLAIASCPPLLFFHRRILALDMATWSYCLIGGGVILELVSYFLVDINGKVKDFRKLLIK